MLNLSSSDIDFFELKKNTLPLDNRRYDIAIVNSSEKDKNEVLTEVKMEQIRKAIHSTSNQKARSKPCIIEYKDTSTSTVTRNNTRQTHNAAPNTHRPKIQSKLYTFKYESDPTPTMTISNAYEKDITIAFQSSNNKTAILAQAICKDSRIKKLRKKAVGPDELYNWMSKSREDGWFALNDDARKKFSKNIGDLFRALNQKIAMESDFKQVFKNTNGGYIIEMLKN